MKKKIAGQLCCYSRPSASTRWIYVTCTFNSQWCRVDRQYEAQVTSAKRQVTDIRRHVVWAVPPGTAGRRRAHSGAERRVDRAGIEASEDAAASQPIPPVSPAGRSGRAQSGCGPSVQLLKLHAHTREVRRRRSARARLAQDDGVSASSSHAPHQHRRATASICSIWRSVRPKRNSCSRTWVG